METTRNLLKKKESSVFPRRFIIIIFIAGRNYCDLVSTVYIIHCEGKKLLLFPKQTLTISRSRWLNMPYNTRYTYAGRQTPIHPPSGILHIVVLLFNIIIKPCTCETMTPCTWGKNIETSSESNDFYP